MWEVIQEIGHYGSLLPLLMCAWCERRRGIEVAPEVWSLGGVLAVSFVADQAQAVMMARHLNTWPVTYVFAPVQFSLWIALLTPNDARRWVPIAILGLVALGSLWRGPVTGPETVIQVGAGAYVAFLAWGHETLRRYRVVMLTYTLAAIPFLLGMVAAPLDAPAWPYLWAGYQAVRVVSWGVFMAALWRVYGPHRSETVGRDDRVAGRVLVLPSRQQVATPGHRKPRRVV